MSQEPRKLSPIDQRIATLAAQRAADDAAVPRSPPPPPGYTPVQLREYLLAKRRLEAERKV
jgi:hypothetical protein